MKVMRSDRIKDSRSVSGSVSGPGTTPVRALLFVFLLALALTAAGCGKKEQPGAAGAEQQEEGTDLPSGETAGAEAEGTDSQTAEPEEESAPREEPGNAFTLGEDGAETKYYRLTLPDNWKKAVIYRYFENPDKDASSLEVCERGSAENGAGGILFSVDLSPEPPTNLDALPCDYLGKLTSEDGKVYYVVFRYPSDVQFDEASEEKYMELWGQIPKAMEGFSGAGGYTFEKE